MPRPETAPYGSWKSPLSSDLIVAETVRLGLPTLDGDDLYWVESRPREKGRSVIVRRSADGTTRDITPPPFSVRSRVHEYGGGAFIVLAGTLYFSNFADQRIYRQESGGPPRPITPEAPLRYADYAIDADRKLLYCVREDHGGRGEPANTLVRVQGAGDERGGEVIASGNDFYSSPRLSPDGTTLAWLTWNHPQMPWDGTELWVGKLDAEGSIVEAARIAGGAEESITQPEWSPEGVLYFASDRTGWWNLYRLRNGAIEALCPMDAELGTGQWGLGMSAYGFEAANRVLFTYTRLGTSRLAAIGQDTLELEPIDIPYTRIGHLRAGSGRAVLLAGSPEQSLSLVALDVATRELAVLRRESEIRVDPAYTSLPHAIDFVACDGATAHAFFYPPHNDDFVAPEDERPPLLVMTHGGPTAATDTVFSASIQYFTTRGIAVLDVNYGGSTGYGRAYRERLRGRWGIVDVDDCVHGALHLVERAVVDPERLMITGGSAGGYTVLCALTFRDVFRAGASRYGISDLEALARDTHKFESRYLDGLVGPYPARRDLYVERSPIHFIDRLNCPLVLLQGAEDKVVPPDQSRTMYESVKAKGIPVAYLEFSGEQHGFRQAENIKRALDAELYFYSQVFGFELAEPVEPVEIANL
jgi:dipeptidyl aminopeptidase/acylaminoacyl peptidase